DGEDILPDLKIRAGADRHAARRLEAHATDFENGKIMLWTGAGQRRVELAAVGQLDLRSRCAFDYMVIGDDMPGFIPDQTGARTPWNAIDIAGPEVSDAPAGRDEDHRITGISEEVDRRLFVRRQIPARSDGARNRDGSRLQEQE